MNTVTCLRNVLFSEVLTVPSENTTVFYTAITLDSLFKQNTAFKQKPLNRPINSVVSSFAQMLSVAINRKLIDDLASLAKVFRLCSIQIALKRTLVRK